MTAYNVVYEIGFVDNSSCVQIKLAPSHIQHGVVRQQADYDCGKLDTARFEIGHTALPTSDSPVKALLGKNHPVILKQKPGETDYIWVDFALK